MIDDRTDDIDEKNVNSEVTSIKIELDSSEEFDVPQTGIFDDDISDVLMMDASDVSVSSFLSVFRILLFYEPKYFCSPNRDEWMEDDPPDPPDPPNLNYQINTKNSHEERASRVQAKVTKLDTILEDDSDIPYIVEEVLRKVRQRFSPR